MDKDRRRFEQLEDAIHELRTHVTTQHIEIENLQTALDAATLRIVQLERALAARK